MWLYFKELILTGGVLDDDYEIHYIRVRLDSGKIITLKTTLRYGSKYLDFANGSRMNIAGISDSTGLVFGLMPHPEAIYALWLHPDFTRGTAPTIDSDIDWEGQGLQIFRNAVEYVMANN